MSYELIETVEVGAGGVASITFSSIPQDGTDLLLLHSLRTSGIGVGGDGVNMIFNADSASNYEAVELRSENTNITTSSGTTTSINSVGNSSGSTVNSFGSTKIYVSNYTSSRKKSVSVDTVTETNDTDTNLRIRNAIWNNTSAITSIELNCSPANFLEHSTASLYKITAA